MNATIMLKMLKAMLEEIDADDEESAEEAIEMMKAVIKQGAKAEGK